MLDPTGRPSNSARMVFTIEVTGWYSANQATGPGIDEVGVRGLVLGEARVDLTFKRYGERIGVFVEGRDAARIPVRLLG